MIISRWLIVISLAVGAGASQFTENTTVQTDGRCGSQPCPIRNDCIVNGVPRNPCPEDYEDPYPDPSPELQPPG